MWVVVPDYFYFPQMKNIPGCIIKIFYGDFTLKQEVEEVDHLEEGCPGAVGLLAFPKNVITFSARHSWEERLKFFEKQF